MKFEQFLMVFKTKVEPLLDKSSGCWLYKGRLTKDGYGDVELPKRYSGRKMSYRVHRLSYIAHNREVIDSSIYVCHTCDTPACCNPEHLFLGTQADNMQDMAIKGRSANNEGTRNPNVKLSEKEVLYIYSSGVYYKTLKKLFGISTYAVYAIKQKRTWKELTDFYDELILDNPNWRITNG